jgi:2-furoyl-CoA dehydrogenase large subunit
VDVCAVEVDRGTGAVQVLDYVTVHDAGVLLNPLLADGQVLGDSPTARRALFERHVYDEWGNLMTAFVDYLTPRRPTSRRCASATALRRRRSPCSERRESVRATR